MMAALRWLNPLTLVVDWPAWALVLAKASVWLLLVWVALAWLRGRHPRLRALLCRGAVVSLVLLCVLTVYVPGYEVGVVRPAYAPPAPLDAVDTATASTEATHVSPTLVAPSPPRHASWTVYVPSMDSVTLVLWAAVAVAMLMRLTGKMRAAGQLAGLGTPADEATMAILRRLARQAGLRRAPRLRVTNAVAGPMLAGLLRPTILLPATQDETGDRAGLSSILAHELAHVRTHDLWWNVALEVLCCVLWFHPAAWRMARIHETACEEACDADAVRLDGNADGYRRTLARLALDMAGVRPGL
ncbi:MAG: M56 family metallopeptidase, partial [bacterium]|nr:M56 family metallopeptidase [bacterium]